MTAILGVAAVSANAAAQSPAAAPPGSELTVYLLTMGPGDAVWEKFGHNALRIHDASAGTDLVYHWGLFDFSDKNFLPRFLKGDMRYSMGAFDTNETIEAYRQANRTVWAQELDLDAAQKARLAQFIAWNLLPENRYYSYDYYRDNCSTRIRDALDSALGGVLKQHGAEVAWTPDGPRATYRFHTERLTQDDWPLYTGTMAGLGHPVDRPITVWEEMFLPVRLMHHLKAIQKPGTAGGTPLVRSERVVFQASRAPEPATVRRSLWGYLFVALALLAAGGLLFALQRHREAATAPILILALVWNLVSGVLGVLLTGLWAFTNHVYSHTNENVLQANPLSLVLAFVLLHLLWRHRTRTASARAAGTGRTAAILAAIVAALSLVGFLLQALQALDQRNGGIIALALPLHIGVAAFLFQFARRSARSRDRGA